MKAHRRSSWRAAIERALIARDRREMASIERVMKALKVKDRPLRTRKSHA